MISAGGAPRGSAIDHAPQIRARARVDKRAALEAAATSRARLSSARRPAAGTLDALEDLVAVVAEGLGDLGAGDRRRPDLDIVVGGEFQSRSRCPA
jgi:hypothetical protein